MNYDLRYTEDGILVIRNDKVICKAHPDPDMDLFFVLPPDHPDVDADLDDWLPAEDDMEQHFA